MRRFVFLLPFVMLIPLMSAACSAPHVVYERIERQRPVVLPRDHYAHDDFQTEWWYYTGVLSAEDQRTFGFELVFFRRRTEYDHYLGIPIPGHWIANPAHLAHFAIADPRRRELYFREYIARDYRQDFGMGGARSDAFAVWNNNWSVREMDGAQVLTAITRFYNLKLSLTSPKPPVLHGDAGYFLKDVDEQGEHGTYYISYTHLVGEGVFYVDGRPLAVKAQAWMDHEYGTHQLSARQVGWDWFSLRMNDDSELMVYLLKQTDGRHGKYSKATFVRPDGSVVHLDYDDLIVEPGRVWRSPREGGGRYVLEWVIRVPKLNAVYRIKPVFDDSEVDAAVSTNVRYWEGMIRVQAEVEGRPVSGGGYMEICGAARPVKALTALPPSRRESGT
jgi:predicted secreted hydrolase